MYHLRYMLKRTTVRLHAVSLLVASWLVLVWLHAVTGQLDRFGTLRGVDFLQFYAAGWVVANGHAASLYDWEAFARRLPELVPGIGDLLFLPLYPPQMALVFAPLGTLSYLPALAIWTLISAALYVGAGWAALRALPALRAYRLEAWCFALGFPPFLQLLAHGQVAAIALALLVAALYGFQIARPSVVGLALGSLVFKPQLGAFALAALMLWPSWRLLGGLIVGAGAQLALVAGILGTALLREYVTLVQTLATSAEQFEPKIWAMHSLRGAIELALGQSRLATVCWLLGVATVIWLARRAWTRHQSCHVRFALICFTGLLLNPHLYVYDLVLLAVPLACLAAWLLQRNDPLDVPVQYLAYSLIWLPLLAPLAAITHIQLTAPTLTVLLWQLGRNRVATTRAASA